MEVSSALISSVTDAVLEEVGEWQSPPLEPLYPNLFLRRADGEDAARGASGEPGRPRRASSSTEWKG